MDSGKIDIVSLTVPARQAARLMDLGWSFDWSASAEPISDQTVLKGLLINQEIQGLVEYEVLARDFYAFVHKLEIDPANRGTKGKYSGVAGMLLASVARESFAAGCDGFVVFVSKSSLYDYYQVRYGAKPLGGLRLYFDTTASAQLIEEFLVGKEVRYG